MLTAFACMKDQQPVMISNDSDQAWNLCCTKLDSDHCFLYKPISISRCFY